MDSVFEQCSLVQEYTLNLVCLWKNTAVMSCSNIISYNFFSTRYPWLFCGQGENEWEDWLKRIGNVIKNENWTSCNFIFKSDDRSAEPRAPTTTVTSKGHVTSPEAVTNTIYGYTQQPQEIWQAQQPDKRYIMMKLTVSVGRYHISSFHTRRRHCMDALMALSHWDYDYVRIPAIKLHVSVHTLVTYLGVR